MMGQQAGKKPKLVVAGASGFIGTAVCRELSEEYHVVVLTKSRARGQMFNPHRDVAWHYCDLFSRREVENALAGAVYAVYMLHVRTPTSRLDQADAGNMNLLLADNFARAAQINDVRQIVFFGGMIAEGNLACRMLENDNEVLKTLSSYAVPVTSVCAGIVAGPGGTFIRLLGNMTLRFPVIFIPKWAEKSHQPISVKDVARAIHYCIGNRETYGKLFDIGGPEVMSFSEMMAMTASAFGKKRKVITINWFPPPLYALWMRILCPEVNLYVIQRLIESLRHHMLAGDNSLQRFIRKEAEPFGSVLSTCINQVTKRLLPNPRLYTSKEDTTDLKSESRVRSIQRFTLPEEGDAVWLAENFFQWLAQFVSPLISVQRQSDGSFSFFTSFPRLSLLALTFKPEHSSKHRRMYFITGGMLLRPMIERRARLEFRAVLNGRFAVGAIHDYTPRLPWYFYISTQAMVHSFVMRAFQKHLEIKCIDIGNNMV